MVEAWKGGPYRPPWQGLFSCELLSTPATGIYSSICTRATIITHITIKNGLRGSTLGYPCRPSGGYQVGAGGLGLVVRPTTAGC